MSDVSPKVYVLTLLALKVDIDGIQVAGSAGASSVLSIQTSYEAAEAEGWDSVRRKYPEADGWFDHQVTVFPLPPEIEIDNYRLTLAITEVGGTV